MVFHSVDFLAFFCAVTIAYFALPQRARWIGLLVGSIFFYGVSEPFFLLQLLAATAGSFWLALKIEGSPEKDTKKRLLTGGVLLLLANLMVFKYSSFLNESFRSAFDAMGLSYSIQRFDLLLPIGISFYTFQLISYLVDVYRGSKAEQHAGFFALYVMFFPKVVAGPIERAKSFLPQVRLEHTFDHQRVVAGLQLMLWGAFKKIVVADRIAPIVSEVYGTPHAYDGVITTFTTWLYAFQIYCDFSGYTDMALGAALVLGFRLTPNFDRPYAATSIQDFWKRWHMSLTSWLTDYVYTPLTRQRVVKIKFYNLMLIGLFATFVVSGLWHGAAWTFVAWGALHGFYIVASLVLRTPWNAFAARIGLLNLPTLHRALKIVFTFNLVCFAYILFRASSIRDALYMMTNLTTGWSNAVSTMKEFLDIHVADLFLGGFGIAVVVVAEMLQGKINLNAAFAKRPRLRWSAYYLGAASVILLGAFYDSNQSFIYFRF